LFVCSSHTWCTADRDALSAISASIKDLTHDTKSAFMALKDTLQLNMTATETSITRRKISGCVLLQYFIVLLTYINKHHHHHHHHHHHIFIYSVVVTLNHHIDTQYTKPKAVIRQCKYNDQIKDHLLTQLLRSSGL